MLGGVFSHFGLPDGKAHKGSLVVKIADTSQSDHEWPERL